jgi:hypothetical protein
MEEPLPLPTPEPQHSSKVEADLARLVEESLAELEQRKKSLELTIADLERKRDRLREEMRKNFVGSSQEIAIRVQGFKDYLMGSLQELVTAVEELELTPSPEPAPVERPAPPPPQGNPKFAEQSFQEEAKHIRSLIDQYRRNPDYYGPPWQLRRTFEPIHAERTSNWFFAQGGRGALRTIGNRLQNILVAAAIISILRSCYGDRIRTLVLANTPERLGEWRRGLQDCLGISRSDFGPDQGVTLFEDSTALIQRADRLVERKQLPLIIIDETEMEINLALLQFPLWLAFAPNPQQPSLYEY